MKSLWLVLLVALALLGLYVASYFVLVEPAPMRTMQGQGPWPRVPHYRLGARTARVYAPVLRLDREPLPRRWLWTDADMEKSLADHGTP